MTIPMGSGPFISNPLLFLWKDGRFGILLPTCPTRSQAAIPSPSTRVFLVASAGPTTERVSPFPGLPSCSAPCLQQAAKAHIQPHQTQKHTSKPSPKPYRTPTPLGDVPPYGGDAILSSRDAHPGCPQVVTQGLVAQEMVIAEARARRCPTGTCG